MYSDTSLEKWEEQNVFFFSALGVLKQAFSIQVYPLLFCNSDSQGTPVVNLIQLAGDDLEWFLMQFSKDDVEKRGLSI